MASALHKWMAQKGSKDHKIHEEEAHEGGEGGMDVKRGGGDDHAEMLKHEMHGGKPFDISEEHASLLGLGEEHGDEGEHGHVGAGMRGKETSGAGMSHEHKKMLGLDDEEDCY